MIAAPASTRPARYQLDTSDWAFPEVRLATHGETTDGIEFFATFREAKAALVAKIRNNREHWDIELRLARTLKKSEVS